MLHPCEEMTTGGRMLRTLRRARWGPSTGRPRRTRLLAVVAALALLVPIGIGLGSAVSDFFGGGTTQTIDRSPDALLLSVRDIADYHAATGTYQVLVDVEQENSRLPRMLDSERSTLFATGSVDARVDFSPPRSRALTTSPGGKQAPHPPPAPPPPP